MPQNAGLLTARCVFEVPTEQVDDLGNRYQGWGHHAVARGQLVPILGREAVQAGQLEASNTAMLRVRQTRATRLVTEAMRVTVDGVVYAIRSIIDPDQRREVFEMLVEKGVAT
jgi:SPP1 family predicted phage head-tail adaptor